MSTSFPRRLFAFGVAAALAASMPFAAAQLVEGRTDQDRRFIAGGIGLEESEQMKIASQEFPLTVIVATNTGAYLADTHIAIEDLKGHPVLETQVDGPYLLVDLARGTYRVEATHEGQKQRRSVDIDAGTHARVVFSFDVPVDEPAGPAPRLSGG